MKRCIFWLAVSALLVAGAADAAPRKGKRPVKRTATREVVKTVDAQPPTTPGIMVPKPVTLINPTPADARAHAVWTLRAALNVAALQCQYSPFLRTVDNYNQALKKHGVELATAQAQMIAHFTRTRKAGGLAGFDRYNTRSYNSFSTLDAQYSFCWSSAQAGFALRATDVGSMSIVAETAVPALRMALSVVPAAAGLLVPPLPPFPDFHMAVVITDND